MRTWLSAALIAVFLTLPVDAAMTPGDRQRLLAHLDLTEQWLASEIEGLTAAQLTYKASPDVWSITEVLEHLAIAEPQYWDKLQASMKQPAAAEKSEATDAAILWYGIDRTNRARTGEARVPTGKYPNAAAAHDAFRKLRATMREYAKSTQDDLRSRRLLEGNMDVYQWFLMISTHSQRHILQIREIKGSTGYPRK